MLQVFKAFGQKDHSKFSASLDKRIVTNFQGCLTQYHGEFSWTKNRYKFSRLFMAMLKTLLTKGAADAKCIQ